jgi:hypothetical protein
VRTALPEILRCRRNAFTKPLHRKDREIHSPVNFWWRSPAQWFLFTVAQDSDHIVLSDDYESLENTALRVRTIRLAILKPKHTHSLLWYNGVENFFCNPILFTICTSCGVAHTHGNVRVDPERPVAVLDRMKSTVVSVDAVTRTRTECSRWPWEVCRCPGQNEEWDVIHAHWMSALALKRH